MQIHRAGSRPSVTPNPDYFTGTVRFDPVISAPEPARVQAVVVTFEPGARSAWHSHPAGQTLIVTSGTGWMQEEGGAKHELKPGDVVWTPPGVKHWHGARADTSMAHIAITNTIDGRNVEWMEKVTDEQYTVD